MTNSGNATDHKGLRDLSRNSEDVARYYDDWADGYDETLAQWRYEAPQQVAARLRDKLEPEATILDAGCGTGLSGSALAEAGFITIDGMDISRRSLDRADERGVYRNLRQVDMQKLPLPFDDNAYDGLVCVGVLTYVPDSVAILREFSRIVVSGGHIVLTQRDHLMIERQFVDTLVGLEDEGVLADHDISAPMPYLPENEEFGDEVQVHYISCRIP